MINMLPNEQLRRERQRRGWSRQYVAEQIGVADPKTIGRWERGVAFPSSYFLQRLCTLYGMFAQDLGLFPEEHHVPAAQSGTPEPGASTDAGKKLLTHELIPNKHMQHISDGIIWASLGLRPNVSDLLGRWGTLLDISATD
ncbi:MAG: helix-turn-helix transcriptional regulator [Ktedonobacteraceae bacterium]